MRTNVRCQQAMQDAGLPAPNAPDEMQWNAERYARNARFVAEYGADVVALLAPVAGERILDLGCGDGALTVTLAERGAEVVGLDASPELIAAARDRGIPARLGDAQTLSFDREFDAVFTNAALHWMPRTDDVLAGVLRALRPGCRFVGEFGGHGNVAAIRTAVLATLRALGISAPQSPWYFPTAERFSATLEAVGFEGIDVTTFARPTPLFSGMRAWLETFALPFAARVKPEEHERFLAEIVELLRPSLCDDEGRWTADYVRLRFAARAP